MSEGHRIRQRATLPEAATYVLCMVRVCQQIIRQIEININPRANDETFSWTSCFVSIMECMVTQIQIYPRLRHPTTTYMVWWCTVFEQWSSVMSASPQHHHDPLFISLLAS